ncbi:MAG: hypothetical protein ACTSXH_03420 [Promethearchaeota archaeon]
MLRTFIYNEQNENWIEEENLLLHDSCALLDEKVRIVYIWNGPKTTPEKREKAKDSIQKLLSKYPNNFLEVKILEEEVPEAVQKQIDQMLLGFEEEEEKAKLIFTHLSTVRLYFFLTILSLILPIASLINLFLSFSWPSSNGNIIVSASTYNSWINISMWFHIVTAGAFLITTIISVWEQDYQVAIFSGVGLLINTGIVLYLSQGIFLFTFQEPSTHYIYYISTIDISWLIISILLPTLIFEVPNGLKLRNFYKVYKEFIFLEIFLDKKEENEKSVENLSR